MLNRCVFLMLGCLLLGSARAGGEGFEAGSTAGWRAQNGMVSVSQVRAKAGKAALCWEWRVPRAELFWRFPGVKVQPKESFGMWLYGPGLNDRVWVSFYAQGRRLGGVWFNLNFTGWRAVGVKLADAGIASPMMVDEVRFLIPQSLPRGVLWLDEVTLNRANRAPQRDGIHPWVGNLPLLKQPFAKSAFSPDDLSVNRPFLPALVPAARIPAAAKAELERITKSLSGRTHYAKGYSYASMEALKVEFARLEISEVKGVLKGRPIQFENGNGTLLPVAGAVNFMTEFLPLMGKLCSAYSREKGAAKDEAERMFLLACRHVLDQGFQEGNGNIGWLGNGYDFRHYPSIIYRMKEPLRKANLLDAMVKGTLWLAEGHGLFEEAPSTYCDGMFNYTIHLPAGIALIPDPAQRYQRFRALKRYYDLVITRNGPLWPDGTTHHHGGYHIDYGSYSLASFVSQQLKPFANTSFSIGPEAKARLIAVLRAWHIQAYNRSLAPTLRMRSGSFGGLNPLDLAANLAAIPTHPKYPFDPDAAAIFMSLCTNTNDARYKQYAKAGIKPEAPTGNRAMNTAAIMVHRRPGWQITLSGMVKPFRGLEIYGWMENNNYAENSRNGSVFLRTDEMNGFLTEGWDHNCWPGVTTIRKKEADLFQGYTMRGNNSAFCGGVDNTRNGIWGGDFQVAGITFKKSAFCFEDTVTVLTMDVKPRSGSSAITTLLQQGSKTAPPALAIDGEAIADFPFERVLKTFPATLADAHGNGYYIHPGSAPLTVQRHEQSWTYFLKRYLKSPQDNPCIDIRARRFRESPLSENAKYYTPTTASYSLATFAHSPGAASCFYTILPGAGENTMQAFAQSMKSPTPPITILSATAQLHAVRHAPSRCTGYSVFDPKAPFPRTAPLQSTSHAGFYLVEESAQGVTVHYATSDPALNGQTVTLRLAGSALPIKLKVQYPSSTSITVKGMRR